MSAYSLDLVGLGSAGRADRLIASFVTSNYFAMLGIQPALGRMISPGEGDAPKTGAVVVLGHHYWEQRFNGDPGVIGRSVSLNGQALTIIGVVPKDFRGLFPVVEMDAYVPIGMIEAGSRSPGFFTDRGRSRDACVRNVEAWFDCAAQLRRRSPSSPQRLAQQFPQADQGQKISVVPERLARPTPSAGRMLPVAAGAFMVLVGLVLLVACVNVANLLLARAASRKKEFAVRSAMGAGRARLIRQSLTETILLALAGWRGRRAARELGLPRARDIAALSAISRFASISRLTGACSPTFRASLCLLESSRGLFPHLRVSRTDLIETSPRRRTRRGWRRRPPSHPEYSGDCAGRRLARPSSSPRFFHAHPRAREIH